MSDADWMVDRRGWYTEREGAKTGDAVTVAGESVDDAMGYEAAYPSPLPAPLPDRTEEQR